MFHIANGHIESRYDEATGGWTPLTFVSNPLLSVHGLASALNYGQQIFEGLKAFRMPPGDAGSDSIALFRPDCHGKRFRHSAEVVDMPPIPADMFQQACRAAVALNACFVPPHKTGWGMYLRPLLFASGPSLVPHLTHGWIFCIYVAPLPFGALDGMPPVKALILDDFDRAAPRGTGHAKTGGNYAGSIPWIMQAKTAGFDLTLHLDCVNREEIEEFSASGFLAVRKTGTSADSDITLVVPDSPTVLPSLTSDSVQQIARALGWVVEKRRVCYEELPYFDEVMSAGTGTGLVPVRSITRRVSSLLTSKTPNDDTTGRLHVGSDGSETIQYIQDEQVHGGPLYRQLVAQLGGVQVGKLEDKFGWRCEVLAEDAHVTFKR
ncbi:aminotransferase [Rhypophila decipiens]|uniref:Aminotransferase n=1 Tax=Rhypophila decipiens TaxID=261697 RepID=A0AAN6Y264_9PEZI|nr:aminotransferase [Rhypophila decipiens]